MLKVTLRLEGTEIAYSEDSLPDGNWEEAAGHAFATLVGDFGILSGPASMATIIRNMIACAGPVHGHAEEYDILLNAADNYKEAIDGS